jgi:DNA mismatch repair protein MutS
MAKGKVTPSRQQYLDVKAQHPDAIVFFRLGDFYETFDDDAEVAAQELDLVLTSRPQGKNQRTPMAGVPHHAAESYIARLIAKGYKVALCEQIGTETVNGLMPMVPWQNRASACTGSSGHSNRSNRLSNTPC